MKWSSELVPFARPALAVGGMILLGLVWGIGGWLIGADDDPGTFAHDPFEAIVESVDDDGREGCLAPVDRTVREKFGGSVCGQVFLAAGIDASQGARVRVRWFTTNGSEDEQNVETFVLESNGPMR